MSVAGPPKKSAPLDDAALEQWLAEILEPQAGARRRPLDGQAQAILSLVDRVRETLVPIQPSSRFVRDLGQSLMQMAGRSQQSLLRRYRTAIWIGVAAAGSIASVVGLAAYFSHQRDRRQGRNLQQVS